MEKTEVTLGMLNEAIRLGEESADRVIKYGTMAIRLRRSMKAAIAMLERGQSEGAKKALQESLDYEERRHALRQREEAASDFNS